VYSETANRVKKSLTRRGGSLFAGPPCDAHPSRNGPVSENYVYSLPADRLFMLMLNKTEMRRFLYFDHMSWFLEVVPRIAPRQSTCGRANGLTQSNNTASMRQLRHCETQEIHSNTTACRHIMFLPPFSRRHTILSLVQPYQSSSSAGPTFSICRSNPPLADIAPLPS
jgi:hypothetical protein